MSVPRKITKATDEVLKLYRIEVTEAAKKRIAQDAPESDNAEDAMSMLDSLNDIVGDSLGCYNETPITEDEMARRIAALVKNDDFTEGFYREMGDDLERVGQVKPVRADHLLRVMTLWHEEQELRKWTEKTYFPDSPDNLYY